MIAPVPADVAQLVERLLAMQKVEGSSPFIRSIESPAQAGFSVFRVGARDSNCQRCCKRAHILPAVPAVRRARAVLRSCRLGNRVHQVSDLLVLCHVCEVCLRQHADKAVIVDNWQPTDAQFGHPL